MKELYIIVHFGIYRQNIGLHNLNIMDINNIIFNNNITMINTTTENDINKYTFKIKNKIW